MKLRTTLIATALAAAGLVSGTAQAALHQRVNSEGPYMVYDDVLDITLGPAWGYSYWQNAVNDAAASTWGGSDNWRLPTISELTSLYNLYTSDDYINLGYPNLANFSAGIYWSSAESVFFVMGPSLGCDPQTSLCIYDSGKSYFNLEAGALVVEVMSGDVAAVPEPETYVLMLAGLGLVGAVVKRRRG
jgi:hypothetical protein